MTGSLLGTPSYMSPEQARGATLDGRSDLFSLGCVLYEMVAGKKAFRGDSITALIFKIITEEPPPLRELDPSVPDAMLRIIGKALAKTPETRYQTGRELADDLLALTRPGFVPTLRATDKHAHASAGRAARERAHDRVAAHAPAGGHHRLGRDRGPAGDRFLDAAGPRGAAAPATHRPDPADRTRGSAARRREVRSSRTLRAAPRLATGSPQGRRGRPDRRPRSRRRPGPRRDRGRRVVSDRPERAGARAEPGRRLDPADRDSRAALRGHAGTAGSDARGGGASGTEPAAPQLPRVASGGVASGGVATRPTTPAAPPVPPPGPSTPASGGGGGGGGDYAYLDDLPSDAPDGRAAGEALAQKYRSGGSGSSAGYPASRFRQRPQVPRGVTVPERPAVATLLYLHSVPRRRTTARTAATGSSASSPTLALLRRSTCPSTRRGSVGHATRSASGGGGRLPRGRGASGSVGRPFLVDDSGIVRLREE